MADLSQDKSLGRILASFYHPGATTARRCRRPAIPSTLLPRPVPGWRLLGWQHNVVFYRERFTGRRSMYAPESGNALARTMSAAKR